MKTKSKHIAIDDRIIELLSDGVPRRGKEIAAELHKRHGVAFDSVLSILSARIAYNVRVKRDRSTGEWVYRMASPC